MGSAKLFWIQVLKSLPVSKRKPDRLPESQHVFFLGGTVTVNVGGSKISNQACGKWFRDFLQDFMSESETSYPKAHGNCIKHSTFVLVASCSLWHVPLQLLCS